MTLEKLKNNLTESVKAWEVALNRDGRVAAGPPGYVLVLPEVLGPLDEFLKECGKWEVLGLAAAGGNIAVIEELVDHRRTRNLLGKFTDDEQLSAAIWIANLTGHERVERRLRQALSLVNLLLHDLRMDSTLGHPILETVIAGNNVIVIKLIVDTVARAQHTGHPLRSNAMRWESKITGAYKSMEQRLEDRRRNHLIWGILASYCCEDAVENGNS